MLTKQEINDLSLYLIEDIKTLNLNKNEIRDRVNYYLENIAGLETIPNKQYKKLVNQILNQAKAIQTVTNNNICSD